MKKPIQCLSEGWQFFPELNYKKPILKAICGRNLERTQAFADQGGYESVEKPDWKKAYCPR